MTDSLILERWIEAGCDQKIYNKSAVCVCKVWGARNGRRLGGGVFFQLICDSESDGNLELERNDVN